MPRDDGRSSFRIQKCAPHRCCSAMKSTSMLFVIIPYSVRWCKLSCRKVRTEQVKFTAIAGSAPFSQSTVRVLPRYSCSGMIALAIRVSTRLWMNRLMGRAPDAVVSRIDDEVLGSGGDLSSLAVLALVHTLAQILQLQIHDLAHLVLGQALCRRSHPDGSEILGRNLPFSSWSIWCFTLPRSAQLSRWHGAAPDRSG